MARKKEKNLKHIQRSKKRFEEETFDPVQTFDDCEFCRFLRMKEGSRERRKFIRETKNGSTIKICPKLMGEIGKKWWQEETKRLISTPKSTREAPTEIDGFKIPKWWECVWRRNPCRERTCRFCGRSAAFERLMGDMSEEGGEIIEKESGLSQEEVERDCAQLSETMQYQARDHGISPDMLLGAEITEDDWDDEEDLMNAWKEQEQEWLEKAPPEPETFLLYRRVERFVRPVLRYVHTAEEKKAWWTLSESVKDLSWYANMLPLKVYRQLVTRWEMRQAITDADQQEFGHIECGYTGYVLSEIVHILEQSLTELSKPDMHPPFQTTLKQLRRLKPSILEIACTPKVS